MNYIGNLNTHNGQIGKLGEDFACEYLINKGFKIIERNFKNKIGEIDIVCNEYSLDGKIKKVHIVEVKTTTSQNVRAEENMNRAKLLKVAKLAEIYIKNLNRNVSHETLFCLDFIGVYLNSDLSLKEIAYIPNLEI